MSLWGQGMPLLARLRFARAAAAVCRRAKPDICRRRLLLLPPGSQLLRCQLYGNLCGGASILERDDCRAQALQQER